MNVEPVCKDCGSGRSGDGVTDDPVAPVGPPFSISALGDVDGERNGG